uniref:Nbas_N domain-containing protein n=1 Tax=Syphacia muris TaxID=451379 RepID=A0A0N5AY25_9BILA
VFLFSSSAVELQWNPTVEDSFAVLTSDGVFSTYLFDFNVCLKVPGTCLSWSPKGKQVVVGDAGGHLHQFKPDMTLVRTVSPPKDYVSSSNCVGLCWLSTTEFLIAYSVANEQDLHISIVTAKKEGLPNWLHFSNVIYCAKQCPYLQRVYFVPLFQWNIVLCASSRSSEVGVLGKHDGVWKMWSLNDNSRIEMPLSHQSDDTFPLGICFDTSSEIPVISGEGTLMN